MKKVEILKQTQTKNYARRLQELEAALTKEKELRLRLKKELTEREAEFQAFQNSKWWKLLQFLKGTTAKSKDASSIEHTERKVKGLSYCLNELGYVEKAIQDLDKLAQYHYTYEGQASAKELAYWYTNTGTLAGARLALKYLDTAILKQSKLEELRNLKILQAECLSILNNKKRGRDLLQDLLRKDEHPDLLLAMANLCEEPVEKLTWINKALEIYQIHPVSIQANNGLLYTRIPIKAAMEDGPKVSVIVPVFNGEETLHVTLESLIQQTWKNIEIIVVDDGSTDRTKDILEDYRRKDKRITYVSTPFHRGEFAARNIGLEKATGEYVTVQRGGDFSHASKIEVQAVHLKEHPKHIGNTSEKITLDNDLRIYRCLKNGYIKTNEASFMFRRKEIQSRIGYWDSVKVLADCEFIDRVKKAFGEDRVIDLPTGPLTFTNPIGTTNSVPLIDGQIEKEYKESYVFYHDHTDDYYLPFPLEKRLFPAPYPMFSHQEKELRHLDILFVADFRNDDIARAIAEQIKVHKELGLRTGLVQKSAYRSQKMKKVSNHIRKYCDGESVHMITSGDKITCKLLIIRQAHIFSEKQQFNPYIEPMMIKTIIDAPKGKNNFHRQCHRNITEFLGRSGVWYPMNSSIRSDITKTFKEQLPSLHLAGENWDDITGDYQGYLQQWLTEENPYISKAQGGDISDKKRK